MSTTSLPLGSTPPLSSRPLAFKAPILASDILREEIAPIAPARRAMLGLLLPLSLGFALWGAASLGGFTVPAPVEASGALVTAGAAALAFLLPVYAARACLATLAGIVPLVLGARGQGPLAALASEGDLPAGAGLLLATLVPAALFFRARYRAFGAARVLLALALLLGAPALFFLGAGALSERAPALVRGLDGLAIAAVLTSLGGFLGPETTGACTAWGLLILVAYGGRVFVVSWLGSGVRGVSATGALPLAVATALGEVTAGAVVALGLCQLLAALFARRARMADIHQIVGPSAEEEDR